jgi:hypothetical protein
VLRFDRYDDAVYAHTDYVEWLRKHGEGVGKAWLADRFGKYGEQAGVPSAVAWQHAIVDALGTDILWLSTEMMDLVQSAMEGFDPMEPVTLDDIFLKSGFMVLPHSFLSKDVNDMTLGWRVLCWKTVDPMVVIVNDSEGETSYTHDLGYEGKQEAGVRFMQASYVRDEDDWSREHPDVQQAVIDSGWNWGMAHATAIPLRFMSSEAETKGEGDATASWLLFWRVAQKLMAERIVSKEIHQPGRAARRDAARSLMPPSLLRVIELRRPRGEEHGERETPSGRRYTHRWIVTGHWRNQPCGPGRKLRRQKYIGEYIKGPEDLDLIVKTRVWNWDR